jgi:hypothetical protein
VDGVVQSATSAAGTTSCPEAVVATNGSSWPVAGS